MKQLFDVDFEIKEDLFILKIIYITVNNSSNKPLNYSPFNIKFDDMYERDYEFAKLIYELRGNE